MYDNFEIIEKLKEYKKLLKKRNKKVKFKNRVLTFLPFIPGTAVVTGGLIWNLNTDSGFSPFNMNNVSNYSVISYIDEDKTERKEESDEIYREPYTKKKDDNKDSNVQMNTITAYSDYFELPDGSYMRTAKVYDLSNFDKDKAIELLEGDTQNKIEELLGLPINSYSEQTAKLDEKDNAKKHYLIKYYEKGKPTKKTVMDEIGVIIVFLLASGLEFIIPEACLYNLIDDHIPYPPEYYSKKDIQQLVDKAKAKLKYEKMEDLLDYHTPKRY